MVIDHVLCILRISTLYTQSFSIKAPKPVPAIPYNSWVSGWDKELVDETIFLERLLLPVDLTLPHVPVGAPEPVRILTCSFFTQSNAYLNLPRSHSTFPALIVSAVAAGRPTLLRGREDKLIPVSSAKLV